tara:strand:+ start:16757 stop:17773 length:1017 start_codon:yes stop_codon:yes gene_type:complete
MPKVIAEIGVNHNNSKDILTGLIEGAASCGVDMIKFQRFISSNEIASSAPLAAYQRSEAYSSQLEMAESLEMDDQLLNYGVSLCNELGVEPICSVFEQQSLHYINSNFSFNTLKLPSPEITNIPLLIESSRLYNNIILSTGASDLSEVATAVKIIKEVNPDVSLSLLHCVSEYPAPLESLNLSSMLSMSHAFKLPIGFSDHTLGTHAAIAAMTLGAVFIEKHITLDKLLTGPDHKASATLDELREICMFSKRVTQMLGDGLKAPHSSELSNKDLIRKSLYINVKSISKGDQFTKDSIQCKRPYSKDLLSPDKYFDVIGKECLNDLSYDQGLSIKDVDW